MTTIYKFAKLLDDDLDNKYVLGYEGFAAKEYVALADYQAQAEEIAKLKGLLERWKAQSKYIKDCFEGYKRWESEALIRLKQDTNEALK